MKTLQIAALLAPLACALAGCATMARGTTQSLEVETTPPGAHVATSNGLTCEATPCTLEKVKREAKFKLTVTLDGYEPATVDVTHKTSVEGGAEAAASFALPGGILFSLVDANFGATQDLTPNPVAVTLTPKAATPR